MQRSTLNAQRSTLKGGRNVEVLIASGNLGKVREFREMLGAKDIVWRSLGEFPETVAVEETGKTFRGNAVLKASGYARASGLWAMADDSGLEVDFLGGGPGVFSARWGEMNGKGSGDLANNELLLEQMKDVGEDRRGGRFVCVLAVADPSGNIILTARDTVEGRVGRTPVGTGGFGYDPLFFVPELGKTTAELSAMEKHKISHRGKALRRLKRMIESSGLWELVPGR